jgi:hypothetical protein
MVNTSDDSVHFYVVKYNDEFYENNISPKFRADFVTLSYGGFTIGSPV